MHRELFKFNWQAVKTDLRRISIVILLMIEATNVGISQPLDYKVLFGKNWEDAITWVEENKVWMVPKLKEFNIDYSTAVSVIFPELVRYSALRDRMEITLCKSLYIYKGSKYADFSIGIFQMKPSFAELVRDEAFITMGIRSKKLFKDKHEYEDMIKYRADIIKDQESPQAQLNYLIAFFKICEANFKLKKMDKDYLVKFLATAYNYGFTKTQAEIDSMIPKRFFNTIPFKEENYSYAEVSLFWYKGNP